MALTWVLWCECMAWKAMVLVRQGEAIPWNLKGLIMGDASCGLQVLYHGTVLTPELNETFLPSLAGQEVALGLVDESPFTVQLKGEAEGIYFLSLEKLHELRDGYPDDYSTLLLRARRVLTAVLGSWVQRRWHVARGWLCGGSMCAASRGSSATSRRRDEPPIGAVKLEPTRSSWRRS